MRIDITIPPPQWEQLTPLRLAPARSRPVWPPRRLHPRAWDCEEEPVPPRIGHNGGPPLETSFVRYCWKRAHAEAWKTPPREVVLRRLKRAQQLGMTYREYTAAILDRGVYL